MSTKYGGPLVSGAVLYGSTGGSLGTPGAQIPATGSAGPSVVYPYVTLPADAAVEFRAVLQAAPSGATSFVLHGDGSFTLTAPDGTYSFTFDLLRDGVSQGIKTSPSIVIGAASVLPGPGAIVLTGYAPTLAQTGAAAVSPGATSIALTGYPPTVARSANNAVATGAGSMALRGYAPLVFQSIAGAVAPGAQSIAITGYAPSITRSNNQALQANAGSLSITGFAPTVATATPSQGSTVTTLIASVQPRLGTAAQFAASTTVLLMGEKAYATDLKRTKTGDGVSTVAALQWDPFFADRVNLTGPTLLFKDAHANAPLLFSSTSAGVADLTMATDAQADAAGRLRWIAGDGTDVFTLDDSVGVPRIVCPDGRTIIGSKDKPIGSICKAPNSYNVATTDPALGGFAVPAVTLAVQNGAPTLLEFTFSPAMYQGSIAAASALTVTKNGSAWGVNSFAWNGATKAIATMASAIAAGDTALVTFAEGTGPRMVSLAGNVPLPSFTAAAVTNNVVAGSNPTPVFTSQSAPGGTVGSFYLYAFAASNATSYAVTSGALPAGLTLASNGFLYGTPTAAASSTFVVTAVSAGGATVPSSSQTVAIAASNGAITRLTSAAADQVLIGSDWTTNSTSIGPVSFNYMGTVGSLSGAGYLQATLSADTNGALGLGTSNLFYAGAGSCQATLCLGASTIGYQTSSGTAPTNLTTTAAAGTIARISRDGSNVVTISSSTDGGATFSTLYTFPGTLVGTINGYLGGPYAPGYFTKSPKQSGFVVPQSGMYGIAPAPLRTYQRTTTTGGGAGKGQGSATVTIDVPSATPVYARTRATDGTTILQAPWQVSASAPAGPLIVSGIDARPVSFFLDIGPTASGPWTSSPTAIQMGRIIAIEGQSLARYMFLQNAGGTLASVGVTPSPTSRVFSAHADSTSVAYCPAQWGAPADNNDYSSAGVAELLRLQEIASGVACAAVGAPVGGTPISNYVPGGVGNGMMRNILDRAGGIEACIVFIGHTDAAYPTADKDFRSRIGQVFDEHADRNVARGSNFDKVFLTMPNINSGSWGTPEGRRSIRNSAWRWCDDNGATFVAPSDVLLADGVHQTQTGAVTLARHMHRALRPGLGLSGADIGPKVTGATRSGVNITLAVSLPAGAATLVSVGAPAQRFTVFPAGATTGALALDSSTPIVVGTNTITLRLAADPGGAVDVHVMYQNDTVNDGAANCIYDDHVDGDGIARGRQLMPTRAPATTDGVVNLVSLGTDQTMTSPFYGAAANGFGQKLTGGYGRQDNGISGGMPLTTTWTWETRFSRASAMGGNEYLGAWGGAFTVKNAGGANNALRLDVTESSTGTSTYVGVTPSIIDGADHHLAVVATPTSVSLYCDGALCGKWVGIVAIGNGQPTTIGTHPNGAPYQWGGSADETAFWVSARYTGATYPVPSAPYVGTEPNLCGLWHFDGNGNAATRTAAV